MKIRGVDKSKHSRIPFQFPLVAPLFVRIPLDEFIVIINGVGDPRCIIPSLSSRYCRGSRKIVYRRLKRKKKKDRRNRANITRNRSPVNLPSFLLVGMHQNVCRLPGSVSIRFVWKSTRRAPWTFVRRIIDLITSIFSHRIMLISNFPTSVSGMMRKIR